MGQIFKINSDLQHRNLILLYDDINPKVRSVMLLINKLKLNIECQYVDILKGEQLTTAFKQINPAGTIPTLIDGDLVLFNAPSILVHIARKYGGVDFEYLYPSDISKQTKIMNILFFDLSVLYRNHGDYMSALFKGENSKHTQSMFGATILECYSILEKILNDNNYIALETLTIADYMVLGTVSGLDLLFPIEKYKSQFRRLFQWFSVLKESEEFNDVIVAGIKKEKTFIENLAKSHLELQYMPRETFLGVSNSTDLFHIHSYSNDISKAVSPISDINHSIDINRIAHKRNNRSNESTSINENNKIHNNKINNVKNNAINGGIKRNSIDNKLNNNDSNNTIKNKSNIIINTVEKYVTSIESVSYYQNDKEINNTRQLANEENKTPIDCRCSTESDMISLKSFVFLSSSTDSLQHSPKNFPTFYNFNKKTQYEENDGSVTFSNEENYKCLQKCKNYFPKCKSNSIASHLNDERLNKKLDETSLCKKSKKCNFVKNTKWGEYTTKDKTKFWNKNKCINDIYCHFALLSNRNRLSKVLSPTVYSSQNETHDGKCISNFLYLSNSNKSEFASSNTDMHINRRFEGFKKLCLCVACQQKLQNRFDEQFLYTYSPLTLEVLTTDYKQISNIPNKKVIKFHDMICYFEKLEFFLQNWTKKYFKNSNFHKQTVEYTKTYSYVLGMFRETIIVLGKVLCFKSAQNVNRALGGMDIGFSNADADSLDDLRNSNKTIVLNRCQTEPFYATRLRERSTNKSKRTSMIGIPSGKIISQNVRLCLSCGKKIIGNETRKPIRKNCMDTIVIYRNSLINSKKNALARPDIEISTGSIDQNVSSFSITKNNFLRFDRFNENNKNTKKIAATMKFRKITLCDMKSITEKMKKEFFHVKSSSLSTRKAQTDIKISQELKDQSDCWRKSFEGIFKETSFDHLQKSRKKMYNSRSKTVGSKNSRLLSKLLRMSSSSKIFFKKFPKNFKYYNVFIKGQTSVEEITDVSLNNDKKLRLLSNINLDTRNSSLCFDLEKSVSYNSSNCSMSKGSIFLPNESNIEIQYNLKGEGETNYNKFCKSKSKFMASNSSHIKTTRAETVFKYPTEFNKNESDFMENLSCSNKMSLKNRDSKLKQRINVKKPLSYTVGRDFVKAQTKNKDIKAEPFTTFSKRREYQVYHTFNDSMDILSCPSWIIDAICKERKKRKRCFKKNVAEIVYRRAHEFEVAKDSQQRNIKECVRDVDQRQLDCYRKNDSLQSLCVRHDDIESNVDAPLTKVEHISSCSNCVMNKIDRKNPGYKIKKYDIHFKERNIRNTEGTSYACNLCRREKQKYSSGSDSKNYHNGPRLCSTLTENGDKVRQNDLTRIKRCKRGKRVCQQNVPSSEYQNYHSEGSIDISPPYSQLIRNKTSIDKPKCNCLDKKNEKASFEVKKETCRKGTCKNNLSTVPIFSDKAHYDEQESILKKKPSHCKAPCIYVKRCQ